jgi:uncharacterized membrane protein
MATGSSLERALAFSDAVFAIAMTILVLELHVPAVEPAQLPQAVLGLLPAYFAFVLSFVVVGMVWLSHHRKFAVIERFDQNLLRLNLLVLVLVASLALPTALLGEFGDSIFSAVLYAGLICAVGFAMVVLWVYACRRGLVAKGVDDALRRYVLVQSLVIPVVFLVSIPVALLAGSTACELTWAVAVPVSIVLPRLWGPADLVKKEQR